MTVQDLDRCEVVTETIEERPETGEPLTFAIECCTQLDSQPCVGTSYVPYESLFNNTRVTGTLFVQVNPSRCVFTVTVEIAGQGASSMTIEPSDPVRFVNLIVDSLRKITFSCNPGPNATAGDQCTGQYTLQLQWCKCC